MTPLQLYHQALALGLRLEAAGDKIAILPPGHCPPQFQELLRQYKPELLAWLSKPACPGWQAIPPEHLPLSPIVPCPSTKHRELVICYQLRQAALHPGPLTAWLGQRELKYYEGVGRHWDCELLAYAAARDAGCWQTNRNESGLWLLLEAMEEMRIEDRRRENK